MYDNSNKKMLIMMILEILKKYSDAQHKLTQPDIIHFLDADYGVTCDRRSVKRNILDLIELGYKINIEGGYYLEERQFDNDEICLIYDSLLQNTHLTKNQQKALLEKISSYANRYFGIDVSGIRGTAGTNPMDVGQVFRQMSTIKDAIDRKKKISFVQKNDGDRANSDQRVVNPYELAAAGQSYYLICSSNKDDVLDVIPVAVMDNVNVLDDKIRPISQIKGGKKSIPGWSRYVQQIVPTIEDEVQVSLLAAPAVLDKLTALFGTKIKVSAAEEGKYKVSMKCGENTVLRFAMAYGDCIEVLAPDSLRDRMTAMTAKMAETYR